VWLLHCCGEFTRKEDMLVEINAGLGMGVWNGKLKVQERSVKDKFSY
jgi:hypothetical protein